MSTLPIPPDLLAKLLDWDENDEESAREHFDALEEVFAALGTPEHTIGLAQAFLADSDTAVRALGFDLLAVQAQDFNWHVAPLIEAANALPLPDTGVLLRRAAANALACIVDDERVLYPLLRFADDADAGVRWQVARGIPVVVDPLPEDAVAVLVKLLRDEDSDVRDWAMFALGCRENDGAELRGAFAVGLYDPDDNTAGEAAVALARRNDPRVLPVLERALADRDVGSLYVDAAAQLGDSRLLPLLTKLKAEGWRHNDPLSANLDRALAECAGASHP
jgi:HEAT repeat protein